MLGDHDLIRRMAAGDASALAAFYDRHAARVLGLVSRRVRRRQDAEDVLQTVFWEAWGRAAQYDPARASPEAWLLLIARSRALDHCRRRGLPLLEEGGDRPVSSDPGLGLERSEAAEQLRQALRQLPAEQRECIRLAFFEGMTHVTIAERLGLPLGTVKTRIRLGMQRLRELLPAPETEGGSP
jgi:RNA polymerase sigma-70 factor (ECF subfamily)